MTPCFAMGIVLNVALTGLALYWLWRQRIPKQGKDEIGKSRNDRGQNRREQIGAPDETNHFLAGHARLLTGSSRHWTGRDLVDPGLSAAEQARALYEASFIVASHGVETDPVFNYANRAALGLFETGWSDFTSNPSRPAAEKMGLQQRAHMQESGNRPGVH